MTTTSLLSVFFLVSVCALCFAGAVYKGYRENMLQLIGMAFVAISCAAIAEDILVKCRELPYEINPQRLAFYGGAFLYALGTAWRVVRKNRSQSSLLTKNLFNVREH